MTTFSNYEVFYIIISFTSIFTFVQGKSLDSTPHNDFRKHRKASKLVKNEVLNSFKIRQICMDVCNPPYQAQEYPPSYGSQYDQYGQYYPSGSNGYDGSQNYPSGIYGYGGYDGSQNYPSGGYAYGRYDGTQNYYPQNQYGQYNPWCYRDMFRKKYNIDPGERKPTVFSFRKSINYKSSIYRRNKNYNYNQDYINCQRICYPMVVPETVPTVSTARTKITRTRTTKITPTTTESSGTNETSEVSEVTLSPPEKPENDTTTSKPTGTSTSTVSSSPSNDIFQSSQLSSLSSPASVTIPSQKQQGGVKSKRKAEHWKKRRIVAEKIKHNSRK